jgi:hypothetical protein
VSGAQVAAAAVVAVRLVAWAPKQQQRWRQQALAMQQAAAVVSWAPTGTRW